MTMSVSVSKVPSFVLDHCLANILQGLIVLLGKWSSGWGTGECV